MQAIVIGNMNTLNYKRVDMNNSSLDNDIFISYRTSDGAEIARIITDELRKSGYSVYYNPYEFRKENEFPEKLRRAVTGCSDLIFICSPDALKRLLHPVDGVKDYVFEELKLANELKKTIHVITTKNAVIPNDEESKVKLNEISFIIDSNHRTDFPVDINDAFISPFQNVIRQLTSAIDTSYPYKEQLCDNLTVNLEEWKQELIEKADAGDSKSSYSLCVILFYGLFGEINYLKVKKYLMPLLNNEVNEYYPHACMMASNMYYRGVYPGEPQSYKEAYAYLCRAADQNGNALLQQAFHKRIGLGTKFDFSECIRLYNKALKEKNFGDTVSHMELARLYINYGMYNEAAGQYASILKATNTLPPEAAHNLGNMFRDGLIDRNAISLVDDCAWANENRPSSTQSPLTDKVYTPDYIVAGYFYRMCADKDPQAALELALLNFRPTGDMVKNFETAQRYFRIAADAGLSEAQYMLGFMYYYGSVEKDLDLAIHYLEKAASQGHLLARLELVYIYMTENTNRNYGKAFHFAKNTADAGVAWAEFIVGSMYLIGVGCESSLDMAEHYINLAEKHGIYEATIITGKIQEIKRVEAGR